MQTRAPADKTWSRNLRIYVNQTVKGGMEIQYRALVTVGNLNGVGGFAIGKADSPAVAVTEASR